MKLFHANLSSAKRLASSHSNLMSYSFIFIMKIHVFCCLPLGFFSCFREYWSAILAEVSSDRPKGWSSGLASLLVITWDQEICSAIAKTVSLVPIFGYLTLRTAILSNLRWNEFFWCFRQCLDLTNVQKHTAHITVKGADFCLNAYVSEENLFQWVHDEFTLHPL